MEALPYGMTQEIMGRFEALYNNRGTSPKGNFEVCKIKMGNAIDDMVKRIPELTRPNVTVDWESLLQVPEEANSVLTIACDFTLPIFHAWSDLYDYDKSLLPYLHGLKEVKLVHDPKRPTDDTGPVFVLDNGILTVTGT